MDNQLGSGGSREKNATKCLGGDCRGQLSWVYYTDMCRVADRLT